jgi:hypothetical protein
LDFRRLAKIDSTTTAGHGWALNVLITPTALDTDWLFFNLEQRRRSNSENNLRRSCSLAVLLPMPVQHDDSNVCSLIRVRREQSSAM